MLKKDLNQMSCILLYTVLGHPDVLLIGFETKASAIKFAHKNKEIQSFCVVDTDHFLYRSEDNLWLFEN